jgi:pimeloyl-ACP methyl ester carboxylesterase
LTIYFISGLGADKRVFKNLKLGDEHVAIFLDWITPQKKESISSYAARMAQQINPSQPFALVGLSFGGMLVVEMLQSVQPLKTFLISSAACKYELPFYYRWAGKLKLDKLIPEKKLSQSNTFLYWAFGVKDKSERKLLKDILNATDAKFTKWAVHEIINWKQASKTQHIIKIHGDRDWVLPIHKKSTKYIIKDGGHLMILNKAAFISDILETELNKTQ